MKRTYLKSLNWFRGLAIIFVFLTHAPYGGLSPEVSNFLGSFFGNGTFFFVFVSGYLFWHLKDKFEYISYMENKFKNVILPYLFVLAPVLILVSFANDYANLPWVVSLSNPFARDGIIWNILVGGMSINPPLWFIPMIIIFFITSPIIYSLANSKYFKHILFLSLSFSILSFRPDSLQYPLYSYIHFFGVYMFGVFCKQNEDFIFNNSKYIASISFLTYILFVFIDYNFSSFGPERPYFYPMFSNEVSGTYINVNQLQKLFGTIFFLSLFFYMENKYKSIELPFFDTCAKYSFGVFFIHYYWIFVLNRIYNEVFIASPVNFKYVFISVAGFSASLVSVYLFKLLLTRLNLNSKLFVGC